MIICVDFDGTLCLSHYPELGVPMSWAVETMQALERDGHYLIVWTCRTGELLLEAINWLLEHEIPFHRVNDHCPDNLRKYGDGGRKVFAHVYIDDRNLGGFAGWDDAYDTIQELVLSQALQP